MTDRPIEELLGLLPDEVWPDDAFDARLRTRLQAELAGDHIRPIDAGTPGTPLATEALDLDTMTETSVSTRRSPRRWIVAAAAAAVLVVGALTLIGGDDDPEVAIGSAPPVFDDGFDDDSAGWISEPTGGVTVHTGDGQQTWRMTAAGVSEVQRPLTFRETMTDTEVTLEVVSVSPGSTVAALCRKGLLAPSDQFYAFRIGDGGASIVALREDGAQTLIDDPSVELPTGPFELTARCVDVDGVAELEMFVDGARVLTASDARPISAGVGGIQVQSATDGDGEVVLDRLTIRRAEG